MPLYNYPVFAFLSIWGTVLFGSFNGSVEAVCKSFKGTN